MYSTLVKFNHQIAQALSILERIYIPERHRGWVYAHGEVSTVESNVNPSKIIRLRSAIVWGIGKHAFFPCRSQMRQISYQHNQKHRRRGLSPNHVEFCILPNKYSIFLGGIEDRCQSCNTILRRPLPIKSRQYVLCSYTICWLVALDSKSLNGGSVTRRPRGGQNFRVSGSGAQFRRCDKGIGWQFPANLHLE